jgi:hypothetical protein
VLTGLRSRLCVEGQIEGRIGAGTPLCAAIIDIAGFNRANEPDLFWDSSPASADPGIALSSFLLPILSSSPSRVKVKEGHWLAHAKQARLSPAESWG